MNNPADSTKKEQKKKLTDGRFFSENVLATREAKIDFTLKGLPKNDCATLFGNGGSGKGFFIQHLLTNESNFLYVKPLKICYLSFEDSVDSFSMRYQYQKKVSPKPIHDFDVLDCIGLNLFQILQNKEKTINKTLINEIFSNKDYDLLILDTWAMASWMFEENSNSDLTQAMSILKTVARDNNCSFLLVHHTNKSALNAVNSTNEGALRGASSIIGNSRLVVSLSKAKNLKGDEFIDGEVIVKMEKVNFIKPEEQHFFRTAHGILQVKNSNPMDN
jgi:RecA-family ATPase